MIETINGIDLLFGAAGSIGTWVACRITAGQRLRIALARERKTAREAAKVAYRMGHEDGLLDQQAVYLFDQQVMYGAAPRRPKTGLQGLLDDIRGGPSTGGPVIVDDPYEGTSTNEQRTWFDGDYREKSE